MKMKSIICFFSGGLIFLAAGLLIASSDSGKVKEERPVVLSMTMPPEVPLSVDFCGETIDMEKFDMYERLDRELSSFTYLHSTTMLLMKRANRFFPVIEPILKENGIPDDFKYLAVIESHLDPRALSPARAMGLWQLLESTAKQFGLTITPTVDERAHVEKSTMAACKYLKAAYAKYGNWATVAASYNAGMGRISGELDKQLADRAFDLWLVEETSRYVFRIIAIKQIFENPYKYGFVMMAKDLYKPIAGKEVVVSEDIPDLAEFAKKHGVTYSDLKQFNMWLRDRKLVTNGKTFKILIPDKEDLYYKKPNRKVHDSRWVVG